MAHRDQLFNFVLFHVYAKKIHVEFAKISLSVFCHSSLTHNSQSHYVNVSVLIKFSQKKQPFYLNYHKFYIKSYVLDVY